MNVFAIYQNSPTLHEAPCGDGGKRYGVSTIAIHLVFLEEKKSKINQILIAVLSIITEPIAVSAFYKSFHETCRIPGNRVRRFDDTKMLFGVVSSSNGGTNSSQLLTFPIQRRKSNLIR